MARWTAIGATAAIAALGAVGIGATVLRSGHTDATAARARRVAVEFFRSQNERQYDRTCRLFSRGFYVRHRLRDRQTCAALLRVSFMWSGHIDFRVGAVERIASGVVVVRAIADGSPGRIVLVSENGELKIAAARGE